MATRNDVARRAGVSSATVSHVINGTKYVSEELRERVQSAVTELDYVPNYAAQMMRSKRTNQITMLVSDISNPYYGEVAAGMEESTRQNKYVLSICSTEGSPDTYISTIIERQTDGVFLAVTNHEFSEKMISMLIRQDIPVVVSGPNESKMFEGKVSTLVINYENAIEMMMSYLYSLGHRSLAFLVGLGEDYSDSRITLFKRFLQEMDFDSETSGLYFGNFPYRTNFEAGYDGMKNVLAQGQLATAVFCTNDLMAFGAIKAIREAGLRIPEDISIIGCDNVFFSETSDPPLSTISIPKREMGKRVVDLLFGAIETGKHATSIVNAELLIRASTGPGKDR